jgi:hypothetical protein
MHLSFYGSEASTQAFPSDGKKLLEAGGGDPLRIGNQCPPD